MLWQPESDCPKHLYTDIMEFLPRRVRKFVERSSTSTREAKTAILTCTPLGSAWCQKHGQVCVATICDVEIAGTPCQDHSGLNLHRQNFEGGRAVFYWAWVVLRRTRREKAWIHENVPQFGLENLRQDLGDLYIIIRIVLSPTALGWASKRRRQFCVGVLKSYVPLHSISCGYEGGFAIFNSTVLSLVGRLCPAAHSFDSFVTGPSPHSD